MLNLLFWRVEIVGSALGIFGFRNGIAAYREGISEAGPEKCVGSYAPWYPSRSKVYGYPETNGRRLYSLLGSLIKLVGSDAGTEQ